jgi:recombination protein RecA
MPKSPKNADGRDATIHAMRAAHSAEARNAASKTQVPAKPRDKTWDKKLEKLQAALEKKFKFRAFSTVASGSRAANIRAQPSGWQEIDDLITGETDGSSKTIAGSGLGWPRGRIIEIYGKESVGKTTLALLIVAAFQRAGEEAAYIDAEHALDVTYAAKLGVDMKRLQLGQPDSAEETLQVVQEACDSGLFGVVVVDSVAALTPEAELKGDMGDAHVGLHARLMSQALRKLKGIVDRRNVLLVFINQTRMKIGVMWGNPETTTGGNALKFYASVRLELVNVKTMKKGTQVSGRRIRIRAVKNKVAPPFREVFADFEPNVGIARVHADPDLGGGDDD